MNFSEVHIKSAGKLMREQQNELIILVCLFVSHLNIAGTQALISIFPSLQALCVSIISKL